MDKSCQNPLCEHPSSREVQVSVEGPSDQKRSLCDACRVAFEWGVQHGRMIRKRKNVWVLAIADRGSVVQGQAFGSRQQAVQGLVKYLKTQEDYDGDADMTEISEWLAEYDERLGVDIFAASVDATGEDSCSCNAPDNPDAQRGLLIEPPPQEDGPELLYRAVYAIDVNARDARQAAESAYRIMTDPESLRPVLHVLDGGGTEMTVDLTEGPAPSPARDEANASREKAHSFVQASGTQCPQCGSAEIEFGPVEVEAQSAFQDASCQDCEARFYAVYRLVGYGLHHEGSCEVHTLDEDTDQITDPSG